MGISDGEKVESATGGSELILHGDNLEVMREMETGSVSLVFTSPPYEAARTYGIDFSLKGQDWVDWAFERFTECLRVCSGLVAWVVEGQTRQFRYSAAPLLLAADLHRAGVKLRKPPIFHRVGIPGSGGPDWLRNDYEFIICASHGKLLWSDNTAMGKRPKYETGGACSNRTVSGARVRGDKNLNGALRKVQTRRKANGERARDGLYAKPKVANPGNVIHCKVGGGLMGSKLAHENEAPFPETLAEFFVRSFCPPEGTVLDPHCGSGTTCAVAQRLGRKFIGIDVRESQVELTNRRLNETKSRQLEIADAEATN